MSIIPGVGGWIGVGVRVGFAVTEIAVLFLNQHKQYWDRMKHIYASVHLDIIGSDNGLSPGRYQAIIRPDVCIYW